MKIKTKEPQIKTIKCIIEISTVKGKEKKKKREEHKP